MTNGDKIRNMTDEELCDFLGDYICYLTDDYCRAEDIECRDCKMKWLKQELKDNESRK